MDEFNQHYKDLVDVAPFNTILPQCGDETVDAVDKTFWKVTEKDGGQRGQGDFLIPIYSAVFTGPQHAASRGGYECLLTKVVVRADQPQLEPGVERWNDYRFGRVAIYPLVNISRAHRSWSEAARGRAGSPGRRGPG